MGKKQPIGPDFDPNIWELPDGRGPGTHDEKAPNSSEIYPNINNYRCVCVDRYFDPEVMKDEWTHLWSRTWTCAGRVSDIPSPGNFFCYELGHESFIVLRGKDNEIRAFYNVCQHRGRKLVDDDFGNRSQLVCPFHSWTYDLEGRNVRVTDREVFSEEALCGDLNLKPVRCETWAGFVFINMNPNAPSLMEFLGDLPKLMKAYKMEEMHVVKDVVLPIQCNWKTGLEAFLESYHLHITHPQALPAVDDYYNQLDIYKNGHSRLCSPLALPSPRTKAGKKPNPLQQFLLSDAGIDPETFEGSAADVRKAIADSKRRPDNYFGLDYSEFTDTQITDDWNYFVFPNMTFNSHPEGILVMRFLPDAIDPNRHYYHVHVIMPKLKPGCKAPFYMGVPEDQDISGAVRPKRLYTTMENPELGEVLEQDVSNMEGVQQGLRSNGFPEGMRYAEHEKRIQVLHAEIDLYLRGLK